jgi:glycosyltransferase involved in cell wall biosynthesis
MIPTFNCAHYLEDSLGSVLAQDPGPSAMQIAVVDDGSSDDPEAVVVRLAAGRVEFHRQPANLGVVHNLTDCIRRSRGEIVHLLHGDDAVRPGFYETMGQAFDLRPDIGAAFCRQIFIGPDGQWRAISPLERVGSGVLEDAAAHLAVEQRIMTPSICVRREVYEQLGGFHHELLCAEDWEMWVRIAAHHAVWFEVEPLALYRMHDDSNTGRNVRTGADIRFTKRAIEIISGHLPKDRAAQVAARARATYAQSALTIAQDALGRRDASTAVAQIAGAFGLDRTPRIAVRAAAAVLRGIKGWMRAGSPPRGPR